MRLRYVEQVVVLLFWGVVEIVQSCELRNEKDVEDRRRWMVTEVLRDMESEFGAPSEVDQAVRFLVEYMPKSDLCNLTVGYVASNVKLAFQARKEFEWSKAVPWTVFLNDVLPYASLTEPRDEWRQLFYDFMRPIILHCGSNMTCGVLALNEQAWNIVDPPIIYVAAKANGLNSYSPFQTMRRHNSSCTGLSIFLIDAMRSVGIPSRIAGVPHWNRGPKVCPHGDEDPDCGNHNWVEAFIDGEWHFIDQRGQENEIDVGWYFPHDTDQQYYNEASVNHSIFASSWAPTEIIQYKDWLSYRWFSVANHFPLAWDWDNHIVPGWQTVDWYHYKSRTKPVSLT